MPIRMATVLILTLAVAIGAAADTADADWRKLDFLLGKWAGEAGEKETPRGAGAGGFSFTPELNKQIVVRRNYAEYGSGPRHDDLMIIYREGGLKAVFFDSEGHAIRYQLAFPAASSVVFESDAAEPGPRFRLSYWMEGESLKGKFEIAPPGGGYQRYLQWSAKREK